MENEIAVFRWITVIVSIIVGLSITRLLTGAVAAFRVRKHAVFGWVPLVWAGLVFVQIIVFWWSLEELGGLVQRWTLPSFILLVGLVLSLFLAAALVMPPEEHVKGANLTSYFEQDGRYALLAIAAFQLLVLATNFFLFSEALISLSSAVNALALIAPLVAFAANGRLRAAATLLQAGLLAMGIAFIIPSSY
ncbi:MAG: hypothetical protein MUC58_12620 [Rhizobiaceae bacterium]|nr:hypothetical protein [Rhizobiaceae bacterium]